MSSPPRVGLKFFVTPDPQAPVDLHPFIPLFHEFIQNASVEGLLIDVADYAHVPDGPGVLLIGHEVDYGLDLRDAKAGLLVTRKRHAGLPLPELLQDVLRKALRAVLAIEADGRAGLRFATNAFELHAVDRRGVANDADGFGVLEAAARPLGETLYGADGLVLRRIHEGDARRALALEVATSGATDVKTLLERIGASTEFAAPGAAPRQSDWDISVEDLAKLRDENRPHVLVDVREQNEYDTANLGGVLIPLGSLAERMGELDKQAHVVVHCKTGGRGARAVAALREAGFENAWNVQGGILAWSARIDPTVPRY